MKYALSLTLVVKNNVKMCYRIDNAKTLTIQYNEKYNEYLLSFKQDGKTHLVGTKHFHITGCSYAN